MRLFDVSNAISEDEAHTLTKDERYARLDVLIEESFGILDRAIDEHVTKANKALKGTVLLYSGGNDSTAVAHLFRPRLTHVGMANTGVGVEATRQFVRDVAAQWELPLLEFSPSENDSYEKRVLAAGFPGPRQHQVMYQRLKERAFMRIRKELVKDGRNERVVFLTGRRRAESQRRANVPDINRQGSIVWVSPMVYWTKVDINTYREIQGDVPRNEVADLIHMSGECLCGSFAHPNERAEISEWYPRAFDLIAKLEAALAEREDIPEPARKWGWGSDAEMKAAMTAATKDSMCSACEVRVMSLFESLDTEPPFEVPSRP